MTTEFTLPDSSTVKEPTTGGAIPTPAGTPIPEPILAPIAAPVPGEISLPDQPSELHQKYWETIKENPDRAAEVLKLSKAFDQEPAFIARNLEDAKNAAAAPTEEYWKAYEKASPLTAEFLKKQFNMAAAKDEYDKLPFYESWVRQTMDGIAKNTLETRLNWYAARQMDQTKAMGMQSLVNEQDILDLEKRLEPYNKIDASVGKNFHPLYQTASQAINLGTTLGAGFAGGAVGLLASPAGATAGSVASAAAAGGYLSYVVEGGSAYRDYIGTVDKRGIPLDPVKAAEMASKVGYINAALEAAGDAILFSKIVKPIGKAVGSVISEPAMKVISKIPGAEKIVEKITGNPGVFAGMTLGQAIREAGKEMLKVTGTEMATEYAQEIVPAVGGEILKKDSGRDFEMKSAGQIAGDATGVLYPTFQSTLLLGLMGGGAHIFNETHAIKQANAEKAALNALAEGSKDVKLKARLPEAYKELVTNVTAGTPVENVYIPVEAAQTYFQSKNIDTGAAMRELGVEEQFNDAVQNGGDIKIPTSVWADKIIGTEHAKGLENDVKLSPDGMTVRQAEARSAEVETLLQQQVAHAQESMKQNEATRAGYDMVFNDIKSKLESVGAPDGVTSKAHSNQVEKAATLWASHAVAEATRRGITVEEFYRGINNPEIQQGSAAAAEVQSAAQYQPEILQRIRSEIEAGDHSRGGIVPMANGDMLQAGVETQKALPSTSTFPKYFKDKGYTKKETLSLLDKQLAGKKLTDKQQAILENLYRASGYDTRQKAPEPFLQSAAPSPAFYSKLEKLVEEKVSNNATPQQILATLREVKPEEMQYSGINEFLKGKEKVSKRELLDFLRANQLEIKEVTKGGETTPIQMGAEVYQIFSADGEGGGIYIDRENAKTMSEPGDTIERVEWDGESTLEDVQFQNDNSDSSPTKFSQYTLPGGENYREVLFTLPENLEAEYTRVAKEEYGDSYEQLDSDQQGMVRGMVHDRSREGGRVGGFRSSHWEEANVLAHTRLSDRTDADGKRILFVEEIQSDWHQAGRKKGYQGDAGAFDERAHLKLQEETVAAKRELQTIISKEQTWGFNSSSEAVDNIIRHRSDYATRWDASEKAVAAAEKYLALRDKLVPSNVAREANAGKVPDAPFKKTWHEFVLKKILRMAAEQGYDRIAWTTGEQQAERYSLAKQIDGVFAYRKGEDQFVLRGIKGDRDVFRQEASGSELAGILGKDLSEKIRELKVEEDKTFSGVDLKVGGEGMKGFYDKILPDFVAKYTKKWGGRVGETYLTGPNTQGIANDDAQRAAAIGASPVHSLDITPQMKEAVLHEGQPLFQAMNGDPRGSVSFLGDKSVISLFKKADASTFVHESAHVWLKDMHEFVLSGKASEAYVQDFNTLSDWLGIAVDQTELTVEQQEKFARGFEAYLLEGKAPSENLKQVFASFRRWLTKIYKNIKSLNVELSPEVRGVMDRMVSSEIEISQAEQSQGVSSQPMEGLPSSLSAELQAAQDRAHEEAVSKLLAVQMAEIQKEHTDKLAKAREEVTKAATEETDKLPLFKAQARLTEEFKGSDPKEIAQKYISEALDEKSAAVFDILAEEHGYSSGDEMARMISNSLSRESYIAGKVEMGMLAHEDIRNTSAIKDEALRAIHSDKQLEFFALEKAAIESIEKKNADTQDAKARRAGQARADYAFIKAMAREILGQKKIRDATAFLSYFTAERNAAVQVIRAMANGHYAQAAKYKEQQMLNHALAMESLRIKKQADKWVEYLKATQKKRVDLFKAQDHFAQVSSILDRFGFPRRDFNPELKTESLSAWSERMSEITDNIVIPDWILNESSTAKYQDMTMDQLEDVVNTLKNIQAAANWEKKAMTILNGMDITDIVLKIDDHLSKLVPEKDKHRFTAEPAKFEALINGLKSYKMSLTKMDTLMRSADAWKDFGLMHQIFIDPVYQAANVESRMMRTASEGIAKAWEPYSKKERASMSEKQIYFPELGASATKMRLIAMALNMGNFDNRDRLFGTPPIWAKPGIEWNQQVVSKLLEQHLTEKDWTFVQNVWDNLNTLWPEIAKLSKEVAGFTPAKVAALPFSVRTADGKEINLQGGYYPLKEDHRASDRASLREQLDQPLYSEKNPGWMAATKTGHTKARAEGAKYAVALDITLINRHIRDVIHDISFRKVIIDLRRITSEEAFRQTMVTNLGPEAHAAIKEWVGSVATGNVAERKLVDGWERSAQWLRSHTTQAVLALKPSVIVQNLANPLLYAGAVENFGHAEAARAWTVRGLGDYIPKLLYDRAQAQKIQQFVFEKSPFMQDKTETPDFSFHETKNLLFGKDSDLSQFAAGLMSGSDNLTNIPMWLEAYHNELERSGDESKAVQYADTLIARTTGSSRKYDQAAYQRGSELAKMTAMFYSFVNGELQRWMAEGGKAAAPGIKNKAKFAGFVASRLILFNSLSLLLAAKHPGDGEDPVKWWIKETAMYPIGFFPGAREVAGVFLDQALGIKSFGYRMSPALSVIDSSLLLAKTAKKTLSADGSAQDLAESAAKLASFVYPYPDQINQWAFNALDIAGGKEPKVEDLYRRKPRKER